MIRLCFWKSKSPAAAVAGGSVSRVETIGGREFTFEAASQAEVDKLVIDAYKVAYAIRPDTPAASVNSTATPTVSESTKSELNLMYRRGEISTEEYLEQSGAVADYLAGKGLAVDSIEQIANQQLEKSWADATNEFLNGPGSDWPGGQKNLEFIGMKVAALGLTQAPDKVAALTQAWGEMKANGTIFEGAKPTSPVADLDAELSPREIMDKWKENQRMAGRNPDVAFSSLFSRR